MNKLKQCLIITAYKNEDNLRKLLNFAENAFECYVHIDKKSNISSEILANDYKNVHFYKKYSINWGGYEHLEAILFLLNEALKESWHYVHIISGEDYPLHDVSWFKRFDNEEKIFADFSHINGKKHHAYRRYAYYWPYVYFSSNYKDKLIRKINLFFVAIQYICPFLNKRRIGNISEVYWGFIWGSYPREAILYIQQYIGKHPEFMQSLRWCKIPEELCFQTILMNSEWRTLMTGDNMRFWNQKRGDNWGPVYLECTDIDEASHSNKAFARKIKDNQFGKWIYERN